MHRQLIERQINACDAHARHIEELLPFADHGAYTQDRDRIRQLRREADAWREILKIVTGDMA
jgi:hypothetical protein